MSPYVPACPCVCASLHASPCTVGCADTPTAPQVGMGQILSGANRPSAGLCPFAPILTCRGGRGVPGGWGLSGWHHRGVPRWQGLAEPPWCSSGAQWPCAGASASPRGLEMVLCPPKPHSALPALPSGGSGGGIPPLPPIQPRAGEWAAAFAGAGGSCRHRQMLSSLGHMAGAWQQRELWPPEEPGPPWGIWGNGGRGGGLQRV